MHVPAHILQQAMELYLRAAYPPAPAPTAGAQGDALAIPAAVLHRVQAVRRLPPHEPVPLDVLEHDPADTTASFVLRLGQPMYPHMKLVLDPAPVDRPGGSAPATQDFILRVDAHDRHLHAPPGSPDAAWLAAIRTSNKELGERIEAAWGAAGLPTFKEYLRRRLQERKNRGFPSAPGA